MNHVNSTARARRLGWFNSQYICLLHTVHVPLLVKLNPRFDSLQCNTWVWLVINDPHPTSCFLRASFIFVQVGLKLSLDFSWLLHSHKVGISSWLWLFHHTKSGYTRLAMSKSLVFQLPFSLLHQQPSQTGHTLGTTPPYDGSCDVISLMILLSVWRLNLEFVFLASCSFFQFNFADVLFFFRWTLKV